MTNIWKMNVIHGKNTGWKDEGKEGILEGKKNIGILEGRIERKNIGRKNWMKEYWKEGLQRRSEEGRNIGGMKGRKD